MLKLPCFNPLGVELVCFSQEESAEGKDMDAWIEFLYEHAPGYVWRALADRAGTPLATKFLERVREKEA